MKVSRKTADESAVRGIATVRVNQIRERMKNTLGDRSRLEPDEQM